jgi:hypothetical protein
MTNLQRFEKALDRQPVDRLLTWDFVDNESLLRKHGGYEQGREYSFEEIVEMNAKSFKAVGLDMTRYAYDPANHWMGSKIVNWIRFFGVEPDNWGVEQAGGTAWIAKRPFNDLEGLERNLPNPPKYEEVREWFAPFIRYIREVFDHYDLVWVGGVEGPVTDAYSYTDMELFMLGIYDAPELVGHVLDCTGKFSAYIAQVYAEMPSSPLLFMGEDICGVSGPMFSPEFLRREILPRWHWIMDADGLHPIERNGLNDIFAIHERYPAKHLFGNVCCEVTLPHGNVFDVEDETLEIIERIGPDGGIFIGSSSELHDLIPVENAETLYRTVHEYGTFPIDVEGIRRRRSEIRSRLHTRKEG